MNVCIAGAGGGIGRRLVEAFARDHAVTGIYRTPKATAAVRPDVEAVAFGDEAALATAVGTAEIVVHAALDAHKRGAAFIAANTAITETLLGLLDNSRCRLFVYFSSQVVYSGHLPEDGRYSEGDALRTDRTVDSYTRLKLAEEARVIAFCGAAGIPYLIVRPTVVMGPGMPWSTAIVGAMRWAPVGLGRRTLNLVHVDDLAADLVTLVARGARNEIYNLGDVDVSSEDYFRCAAEAARRRPWFVPAALAALGTRPLPSTLWFLKSDVRIDCSRIKAVTGRQGGRPLPDYFPLARWTVKGKDLETIIRTVRQGQPLEVRGQGYSSWFNDPGAIRRLSLADYRGIIGLVGNLVTVKAGTPLSAVLDFLDGHGLTLATLPEFTGISAGACFFTEVHGSSADYVSVYDLIEQIAYVDADGREIISQRDLDLWDRMRQARGVIVTRVIFRCIPLRQLCNRIEWRGADALDAYLHEGMPAGTAVTVEWYPKHDRLLVYNVTPAGAPARGDIAPFLPLRGLPYRLQRALLSLRMGKRTQIVGKSHEILAPWRAIPFRRAVDTLLFGLKSQIRNMEVCVPAGRAGAFFARLRESIEDGRVALRRDQGIGVRFTAHPQTGRAFVWVETTSRNLAQLHQIVRLAQEVCGSEFWLHQGKYVPPGIGPEALFIPRQVPADDERLTQTAGGRL